MGSEGPDLGSERPALGSERLCLVQSQVRFKRVPEKVPEKVPEATKDEDDFEIALQGKAFEYFQN